MAVYLKEFENHTQYENYINGSGAILPNVSICTTEGDVHYNPYVDPYAGHDYVDLGLSVKWATMNIGATSETDYGLYFQWGDTSGYTKSEIGSGTGKKNFGWADYKYGNGTSSAGATGMTKYNSNDKKTVLDLEDDAAHANMGGNWRMPTEAEFKELIDKTNKEWTNVNNVNGYKFTSKTDSSKYIFFPAASYCNNGSLNNVGRYGYYWSSSLYTSNVVNGRRLFFNSDGISMGNNYRCFGFPVRGVVTK